MGIIQKQSIKGLAYSYTGAILGFITTGYLMPRFLAVDEIGLIRIIVSYATLLAQFSGLGFSIVVVKMFPYFRDPKTKHHGFMGLFLLVSLLGFILTLIFFYLYKTLFMEDNLLQSPLLQRYFIWIIPLALFILFYTIADTFYRSLFNATKGIAFKEVLQRILILIALILFIQEYILFNNLVSYYFIAFVFPPVFLFYSLWKEGQIGLKPDFVFIDKKIRKKISNIAFFGMIASFSGILVINIDVLMIQHYLGLSAAGIYTITFFFGALILIPSRPLTRISSIIIAESFKNNDLDNISLIYKKSSINLTIISIWVFLGLVVNMENIIHIIGEDYRSGYYVILLIGLSNVIDMTTGVINQVIFNSNFYKYSSYLIAFFAVILIISNMILIPIYGIVGAAMATLFSKIIYNVLKIGLVQNKLRLFPYSSKTMIPIIIVVIIYFTQQLMKPLDNYIIDIVIRSSIVSLLYLVPIIWLKVSSDINDWFNKIYLTIKSH